MSTVSCNVTRRELVLGAINTTTGWYGKTYTATTIKGLIEPKGISRTLGVLNRFPNTFRTADVISEGDEIIMYDGKYYSINGVNPWAIGDNFQYFDCDAEYLQFHSDRPVTYGTGATILDSRHRTKQFIDAYVSDAAITNDSGTQASWISCWNGFDYPLYKVMLPSEKNIDGIYNIFPSTLTTHLHENKSAYAYTEQVPIQIITANKAGITADNLQNKMAMELRRIIETYPTGSLRSLGSGKPDTLDSKNQIYEYTYTLTYKRAVETAPTHPTITYGSGGTSGTFTFPNVTKITPSNSNNDTFTVLPSRIGEYPEGLGAASIEIQITCDLDMEPATLTWKRSQTTNSKTDACNFQVFLDIMHNGAVSETYQTLDLGWATFPVRLIRMDPAIDGEGNMITLTFKEYNATAGNSAYKTRWGIP